MENQSTLLSLRELKRKEAQKRYRAVGVAMFVIAAGLLIVRTVSVIIGSIVYAGEVKDELLVDTVFELVFSVLVQIVILLTVTFLIYKIALKMKPREVLEFSNFRKTKWFNIALSIPLGILALFVTIGVSTFWVVVVTTLGYNNSGSATVLPDVFNPGLFILQLTLTALLPGICEEFAVRGGFFTTMNKSYRGRTFYFIMAIAFGLFHQNIMQVFYTALFGAVMAFVLVKTKSIFPCIIIHFFNNATSVYLDYAEAYRWPGGEIMNTIFSGIMENFGVVFFTFLVILAAFIGLLVLLHHLNPSEKRPVTQQARPGFSHSGWADYLRQNTEAKRSPYPYAVPNESIATPVAIPEPPVEERYKPSLRDNAFYIGAIVITALFTVFSFVWGWFY